MSTTVASHTRLRPLYQGPKVRPTGSKVNDFECKQHLPTILPDSMLTTVGDRVNLLYLQLTFTPRNTFAKLIFNPTFSNKAYPIFMLRSEPNITKFCLSFPLRGYCGLFPLQLPFITWTFFSVCTSYFQKTLKSNCFDSIDHK